MKDLKVPEKRFRPEIEGVRTVATLLIVMYHIWFDRVSGGIDVFFIVSGFLITTSLLNQIELNGYISFKRHIVGIAKRLVPLASLVIIVVGIAAIFILFQSQWIQTAKHLFASLLFYENWRLAFDAVDYLERDSNVSPFQHFWSLSIQGQFYVIWPFVIMLAAVLAKKLLKTPLRKTLLSMMSVIFVLSLSYSVYKTADNQPWAYFDSFARAWEFSIGGMFALLLPYLRLPKAISFIIGWLGLAIICLTGILLSVSTVFPGYAALLPISGVLFILISSENASVFGVTRILSIKPLTFMGGLTYGIYLWHWPLLVLFKYYFDISDVSFVQGLLLIIITIILSYVSYKTIEVPIRSISVKASVKKGTSVVIASIVTALVFATLFSNYVKSNVDIDIAYGAVNYPGASVLHDDVKYNKQAPLFPSLADVKYDTASFYKEEGCFTMTEKVTKCSFGVINNPDYVIALVGGSHSGHWYPALEAVMDELNIQVDVYNHDGCRFSADDFDGVLNEDCMKWNGNLIDLLKGNPPDLVFTTANVSPYYVIPSGYLNQFKALDGVTNVFAVRDTPRPDFEVPACLERHADDIDDCSFYETRNIRFDQPLKVPSDIPDNVFLADFNNYICGPEKCDPVVGNLIVYRDKHHLTAQYSKTLAPYLKKELLVVFEWLEAKKEASSK